MKNTGENTIFSSLLTKNMKKNTVNLSCLNGRTADAHPQSKMIL